jgi:predicted GNAT family acetyltransferase
MRDLCRLLLDHAPAICLFVRPENEVAIRVYEAIGMRRHGSYRSLIF